MDPHIMASWAPTVTAMGPRVMALWIPNVMAVCSCIMVLWNLVSWPLGPHVMASRVPTSWSHGSPVSWSHGSLCHGFTGPHVMASRVPMSWSHRFMCHGHWSPCHGCTDIPVLWPWIPVSWPRGSPCDSTEHTQAHVHCMFCSPASCHCHSAAGDWIQHMGMQP